MAKKFTQSKASLFLFFLVCLLNGPQLSWGQINMTTSGSHFQQFNSLPQYYSSSITWIDNSSIPNWYSQRTGAGTTLYPTNGQQSTGGLYAYSSITCDGFGCYPTFDISLGSIGDATAGSFAHGVLLRNTSGAIINSIGINYWLRIWRPFY